VDLGEPDNAAQAYSGPVMARRAGHCVVAYSLLIREGPACRSRRAQPGPALPPFLESIFGNQSKGWSLARLAAQLRRQLQQTRLTPALPGEIEPPVAPALNPN